MANTSPLISTQYSRAYTTFGGPDIKCVVDGESFMYLLAIGWSVTREKAPQYMMGDANPKAFTRGKRGIAGTMMASITDKEPLLFLMRYKYNRLKAGGTNNPEDFGASAFLAWVDDSSIESVSAGDLRDQTDLDVDLETIGKVMDRISYADQMMPFDILLAAANEYGNAAFMSLENVEILSSSAANSLDSLTNEVQYTWVATRVNPWLPSIGDRSPNPAVEQVAKT